MKPAKFTNGKLYDMGYYPMLVEEGVGIVHGKIVCVATGVYEKILKRLDQLEGYMLDLPLRATYRRVKREAAASDSSDQVRVRR